MCEDGVFKQMYVQEETFSLACRQFANVTANDVVGMRAPYLKPGRNTQYKVCELLFTEIVNDHESNA